MENDTVAMIIAPPGRLRGGLRAVLQAVGRFAIVAEADDVAQAPRLLAEQTPALVVLDARSAGGQAGWALRQLKLTLPRTPCVVIAHTFDQVRVARAAGADATLSAGFSAEELTQTIRTLAAPPAE